MKAVGVSVPKKIIGDIRDILNRSVMGRERVQKQIVPKRFQYQQRALNEGIVARQKIIVPDTLTLQRRHMNENCCSGDRKAMEPDRVDETCKADGRSFFAEERTNSLHRRSSI